MLPCLSKYKRTVALFDDSVLLLLFQEALIPVSPKEHLHQPNSIHHNHFPICNVSVADIWKQPSFFFCFFLYLVVNRSLISEYLAETSYIISCKSCIHLTIFSKLAAH